VQVLLIAVAIACGTGAAWSTAAALWGEPMNVAMGVYGFWEEWLPCFIGCIGFAIIFNIHGPGMILCALGGILAWAVYRISLYLGTTDIAAYFFSCAVAAIYSEVMARIRKYPAIGYLLVSIFPLLPGAGVYYTMHYAVKGEMSRFAEQGMHTISIAGIMAVAILLVSTIVRMWTDYKNKRQKRTPLG
jgi:uncharacterized membrane protein YjjB (DUF3815 family)